MNNFCSVIICTHIKNKSLWKTLNTLLTQNYPNDKYEIIVVDNNLVKNSDIENKCNEIKRQCFDVKYIHSPILGLSNARNIGLSDSKGEIVCFIDDDANAAFDWVETVINSFNEHPQAGVIGGHIILKIPNPKPKILSLGFEIFWSQFITDYSQYTEVDSWQDFPWGANWCARREAILAVGGFNKNYGRGSFGRKYWCGEELIAAQQIQNLGYKIAIEPKSTVIHEVDSNRFTLSHLWNVILSDKLVRYQAQKDGLLPKKNTRVQPSQPKTTRKRIYDLLASIQEFINRNAHPILLFYQISAHVIIFSIRILDFFLTQGDTDEK